MFTCTEILPKEIWSFNPSCELLSFCKRSRMMWKKPFFFFFFQELPSRTQLQLHPVCTLVPMGPQTHRSTDTRQSDSEKQSPLSSFQPQISEPDMTRLSFRQLSLFVIWRPGFLETSIEFISCVCWGNTEDLSSLKEVKQPYDTKACCLTPVLAWKIFGKSQTCP